MNSQFIPCSIYSVSGARFICVSWAACLYWLRGHNIDYVGYIQRSCVGEKESVWERGDTEVVPAERHWSTAAFQCWMHPVVLYIRLNATMRAATAQYSLVLWLFSSQYSSDWIILRKIGHNWCLCSLLSTCNVDVRSVCHTHVMCTEFFDLVYLIKVIQSPNKKMKTVKTMRACTCK